MYADGARVLFGVVRRGNGVCVSTRPVESRLNYWDFLARGYVHVSNDAVMLRILKRL